MPGPCAVHQRVHSPRGEPAHQRLDRQHQGGRARDVIQQAEPRARAHPGQHGVYDLLRCCDRERQRHHHHLRPATLRHEGERVAAGLVAVIGGQELISRRHAHRPQHRVDPRGGVADEGEVVRVGTDEGGQRGPRRVEPVVELAPEEAHRLGLELGAQRGLQIQDLPRARPVGAVVEERDAGIERPEPGPARALLPYRSHRGHRISTPAEAGSRRPRRRGARPPRSAWRPRDRAPRSGVPPAARPR